MLTISTEKVCHIIVEARVFDADMPEDDEDPGSGLGHDEVEELEERDEDESSSEGDHSVVEAELREFIHDMNEDEQIDLVTLTWIGRGSFSADEWKDARKEAAQAHNDHTADYLLGIPLLADYLEEGLNGMGLSCG